MNKSIAVIGVVAVLAALYALVLSPLAEKRVVLQDQLQLDYSTLVKYKKFENQQDQSSKKLDEALNELAAAESLVLPHSDTSLAFSQLQKDIQKLATQSGLQVTSVKPLPTVEFKHYTGLPIFLDCTGDIKSLGEFMKRLDSRDELFGIDKLIIAAQQDGTLRIKIQLTGLMMSS